MLFILDPCVYYIGDFHSSWSIWVECQHGYGWLASYVFAMVMGRLVFVEIYTWLTGFGLHTWLNDHKLNGIDDLLTSVFCDGGFVLKTIEMDSFDY